MSDFEFDPAKSRRSTPKKDTPAAPTPPAAETTGPEGQEPRDATGKPEYTQEELLQVFDEILFSNEYTESFVIRNRLKVTFKTRTAKEIQDIDKKLDSMGSSLVSTVEGVRSFMHLENALVSYQGKDLATMKHDDRSAFVQSLPGAIVGAMMLTLNKFDRKVALACQVGEENF